MCSHHQITIYKYIADILPIFVKSNHPMRATNAKEKKKQQVLLAKSSFKNRWENKITNQWEEYDKEEKQKENKLMYYD